MAYHLGLKPRAIARRISPGVKTPGYFLSSLRDYKTHIRANVEVPSGRQAIARQFIAGGIHTHATSPVGTAEIDMLNPQVHTYHFRRIPLDDLNRLGYGNGGGQ